MALFDRIYNEPVHFVSADADVFPCDLCCPMTAWSDDGMRWECEHTGRTWLMLGAEPDVRNHPIEACNGKCGNPLHTYNVLLAKAPFFEVGWGDVALAEDDEVEAALSPAERAVREADEARRAAAAAAAAPLIAIHAAQMDNIQRKKISAGCKTFGNHTKGEKKHQPCRNLYTFDHDHNRCMTKHVSSECWAHVFEDGAAALYVDAVLGAVLPLSDVEEIAKVQQRIKRGLVEGECQVVRKQRSGYTVYWTPRTCWMTHPDEPSWFAGWNVDSRAVDPKAPQPRQPQQQPRQAVRDFRDSRESRDFRGMAGGGGGGGMAAGGGGWETAGRGGSGKRGF